MTRMRESMPRTLAKLEARLSERSAAGKSADVVDVFVDWLHDPSSVGVFMRLNFKLADGDVITIDTIEAKQLIAAASQRMAIIDQQPSLH